MTYLTRRPILATITEDFTPLFLMNGRLSMSGPTTRQSRMSKLIKLSILIFWLVMLALLIERTYLGPSTVIAKSVITEEGLRTGDEWSGIYQQGRKIGYAHSR